MVQPKTPRMPVPSVNDAFDIHTNNVLAIALSLEHGEISDPGRMANGLRVGLELLEISIRRYLSDGILTLENSVSLRG